MKNKFTLFFIFCSLLSINLYSQTQAQDVAKVKAIVYNNLYNQSVNSNVSTWMNSLVITGNNVGRWADINYTITTTLPEIYSPATHLDRLQAMCLAYVKNVSGNTLYNDPTLRSKIIAALNDNIGRTHVTVFSWDHDWWLTYIDLPQRFGNSLLLMNDKFTPAEMSLYYNLFTDPAAIQDSNGLLHFANQGQNLVWACNSTLLKSCISSDYTLMAKAFSQCAGSLDVVNVPITGLLSGFKTDYSYHIHGEQLYSGGYGLWFISDILGYISKAQGTMFINDFTTQEMSNLSECIRKGYMWFTCRQHMDFGSNGRDISRKNDGMVGLSAAVMDQMCTLDPANAAKFTAYKNYMYGAQPFPDPASRYFWQTDMLTSHGSNYYMSVKMVSNRTDGTEIQMNTENIKGYYLPLGATNFMIQGTEYVGTFAAWDWSRIPGTTSALNDIPTFASQVSWRGTNSFAGGVAMNKSGVCGFVSANAYFLGVSSPGYNGVSYNKAYFMFDSVMVCLGANISSIKTRANTVTSVNQGVGTYRAVTYNAGTETTLGLESKVYANNELKWVHYNNMGYIFPNGGNLTLENVNKSGQWYAINNGDGNKSTDAAVTNQLFSIWFDHGVLAKNQTYQYIVAMNQSLTNFKNIYNNGNTGYTVVQNTNLVQAVKNDKLSMPKYGMVFYQAGSVDFGNGLVVSVDNPAIVYMEGEGKNLRVAVSDPNQNLYIIRVTINQVVTGAGTLVSGGNTTITFPLPTNEFAGSTVTGEYQFTSYQMTGVNDVYSDNSMKTMVYPNPSNNIFRLSNSNDAISKIQVCDFTGRLLLSKNVEGVDFEFGHELPSGIFMLNIIHKNGLIENVKLIKH
jgi:chondroitin AC lyase